MTTLGRSIYLQMNNNDNGPNHEQTPLVSFLLELKNQKGIEGVNYHYSSLKAYGGHIVKEKLTFIPREKEANEIVECMRTRRNIHIADIVGGNDKVSNLLIAIPGCLGMGKSTFLYHFPDSNAYKEYINDSSPIVSIITFSNGMGSKGVDAIGLRIIYGAIVSMGLMKASSYPWITFYDNFISSLPSTYEEILQSFDILTDLFGKHRRMLILVDELAKSSDMNDRDTDKAISIKLGSMLNCFADIDIVVSSLSPAYIQNLAIVSQRKVNYVILESMIDTELGHPRSIEGMIDYFNDARNEPTWTGLENSAYTVLLKLVEIFPIYTNCYIDDADAFELEMCIFNTPPNFATSNQIFPLHPLFLSPYPLIKSVNQLFVNLGQNSLSMLFQRIIDFTIVSRSHQSTSLPEMFMIRLGSWDIDQTWSLCVHDNGKSGSTPSDFSNADNSILVLPRKANCPGYHSLVTVFSEDNTPLHFYLQMTVGLPRESFPDTSQSLSSLYIVLYVWGSDGGGDDVYFSLVNRDLVKNAARIAASNMNTTVENEAEVLQEVGNFDHIQFVNSVSIEKWLNPSFLPFLRLLTVTEVVSNNNADVVAITNV
eukprot:gene7129-14502_t